ncbi:adenosylmethionine decarboxylase [Sphingomonas sp. So64.6b]|uniref:adenosylmethionine decarboxylase n=1 Tax=Sphingomonas sp. So64.6b TaxID=2997354 RepID=UPI001600FBD0|nr:adenosylmethionine decarboxylase [Sphingomonas sp. So64.6b]QNA83553.1 adenosylmethionine decarboxylase [Sphingomonas sp. So64.6b]
MDFTGTHLLIDLFGCTGLDDIDRVEATLRDTVAAAGATLLALRLHSFGVGQGVTGVAMLAESHISIHTWPERDYAAADIFLCGRSHDLDAALATLAGGLGATRYEQQRLSRGYGVEPVLTRA